jgi:hypothetical protein
VPRSRIAGSASSPAVNAGDTGLITSVRWSRSMPGASMPAPVASVYCTELGPSASRRSRAPTRRGQGGVESRTLRRARHPVMCGLLLRQNAGFPGTGWLVLALTSSGPGAGGCLGLRCPRTILGKAREGASGFAGRTRVRLSVHLWLSIIFVFLTSLNADLGS